MKSFRLLSSYKSNRFMYQKHPLASSYLTSPYLTSTQSMLRRIAGVMRRHQRLAACSVLGAMLLPTVSWTTNWTARWGQAVAQSAGAETFVQVTVNSAADGPARPDEQLTLREAIELTNGTLSLSALSDAEQRQVVTGGVASKIGFDLPENAVTIELESVLPAIAQPGLTLDGTTQSGYDPNQSATAEIAIPIPVVAIRPKADTEVFRGLTISASDVTVRGLALYGFNAPSQITQSTPPADIFISHQPIPLRRDRPLPDVGRETAKGSAPSGVVIEQNWLGITPTEAMPDSSLGLGPSGFGISVFDSAGITIENNRIEYHNGSAIITGRQADNLEVLSNIIVGNGLSGMPDAIRLDGSVENGLISRNLLCGNDGSSVFLFKPEGSVTVFDNDIRFNGQRLRRAAIYVMGDGQRIL